MSSFEKPPRRDRPGLVLQPGQWLSRDARARLSELVRRARGEGLRHVTLHGREEVVVLSEDEFRGLEGHRTGAALIEVMQASPHRDIDIESGRGPFTVRDVIV